MKKLLTSLTALVLLFGVAACTVTENNSSEPPASSEDPTSSNAPASSDITSSEPPASSVVTPSNLPFIPETSLDETGVNYWSYFRGSPYVWDGQNTVYFIANKEIKKYSLETSKISTVLSAAEIGTDNLINSRTLALCDNMLYFTVAYYQPDDIAPRMAIYKSKTDGTEKAKITDVPVAEIDLAYVYEGYVYTVGIYSSFSVYHKVKVDGSEEIQRVSDKNPLGNGWFCYEEDTDEKRTTFFYNSEREIKVDFDFNIFSHGFCDGKVYYRKQDEKKLCWFDITDTEIKGEIEGIFKHYTVIGNWIFYIDENNALCKIDVEGNGYEQLESNVRWFKICGNNVIFKRTEKEEIEQLSL